MPMNFLQQGTQEEQDLLTADSYMKQVVDDNVTSWRFRTLVGMNPYMANDPAALSTMAGLPIADSELFRQAGEIYGMTATNSLLQTLPNYSDSYQRAIFNSLSPSQQLAMKSFGYEPPKRDAHSNGFWDSLNDVAGFALAPLKGAGKLLAPITGPTFKALDWAAETVAGRPFRTIRQLDDVSQILALVAGTAAAVAIPATAGLSSPLSAFLLSFGVRGIAGMAAATGTAAASSAIQNKSFQPFYKAWVEAENGERLFLASARKEAYELLNDPILLGLAEEISLETNGIDELYNLARDIVGVRGGGDPTNQIRQVSAVAEKYADPGTQQYAQISTLIGELLSEERFTKALTALEKGKISFGRDLVRGINGAFGTELEANKGVGRWVSGATDAFFRVWLDPFNLAGGAFRSYSYIRRGLKFADPGVLAARLEEVAKLPEVQRKWQVIADAVNAEDVMLLNRGAREYKPIFVHLLKHKLDNNLTMSVDDVFDWMKNTNQLTSLQSGIGLVHGFKYPQIRGLNRTQAFIANTTADARDVLRGIADIGIETANFDKILKRIAAHPELQRQLIEHMAGVDDQLVETLVGRGLDEEAARLVGVMVRNHDIKAVVGLTEDSILQSYEQAVIERAQRFLVDQFENPNRAYQFGRTVGGAPIGQALRPLASLVDGLTSQIPRRSIALAGNEMVTDVENYIELMRHANVPSYVRNAWKAGIFEGPTSGSRLLGLEAMLDSIATASGMRMSEFGNSLLDNYLYRVKQIYSTGRTGRYDFDLTDPLLDVPTGALPDVDMAVRYVVPNLHEIRKAASQAKLLNALLGVPESVTWQAIQNKIWKPLTLLRLGFLIRNLGEEVFATIMRYGPGGWASELVAKQITQRRVYNEAKDLVDYVTTFPNLNANSILKPEDVYALSKRWDVPMSLRPVARAIDVLKDGQPWQQKAYDYLGFLRNYIDEAGSRAAMRWTWGVTSPDSALRRAAQKPLVSVFDLKPVDRRELFSSQWRKLAFGNEHSLRRMLIGGVDPKFVKRSWQFERTFAQGIMEEVGTTKNAPYDPILGKPPVVHIIGGEDVNSEGISLVQSYSERILTTRDNPIPEAQPYALAVARNVEQVLDDDLIGRIYGPTLLYTDAHVQETLGREGIAELFSPLAKLWKAEERRLADDYYVRDFLEQEVADSVLRNKFIDRDLLQLWSEIHSANLDKARFDAAIRRMRISDKRIAELEADVRIIQVGDKLVEQESPLLRWALERNRLVDRIQREFVGTRQPTWSDISSIFDDEAGLDGAVLWTMPDDVDATLRAVPQEQLDDAIPFAYPDWEKRLSTPNATRYSRDRLRFQLDALNFMSSYIANKQLDGATIDWIRMVMYHWQADPSFISQVDALISLASGAPAKEIPWPFYESLSDVRTAMSEKGLAAIEDPVIRARVEGKRIRPNWLEVGDGEILYVVDTRVTGAIYGGFGDDAIAEAVQTQTPIVVRSRIEAETLASRIGRAVENEPPILVMDVPKNASALNDLSPYTTQLKLTETQNPIVILGMPDDTAQNFYDRFPALWNWLETVAEKAEGSKVVSDAIDEFFARISAGRRTRIEFQPSHSVPEVYVNQGGVPWKLEQGDLLQHDDELFTSPNLEPESKIAPTDQRISRTYVASYKGNDEIMWSIFAPATIDRMEPSMGLALYEAKAPIYVPGQSSQTIEIPQTGRRLRALTKKNVLSTPAADLPDLEVAMLYKPYKVNPATRTSNAIFEWMGRVINAVSRKPMAFHAFNIAADRNETLIRWLIKDSPIEKQLEEVIQVVIDDVNSIQFVDRLEELGRIYGVVQGVPVAEVNEWSRRQAVAFMRGLSREELLLTQESLDDILAVGLGKPEAAGASRVTRKRSEQRVSELNGLSNMNLKRVETSQQWFADRLVEFGDYDALFSSQVFFENTDDLLESVRRAFPDINKGKIPRTDDYPDTFRVVTDENNVEVIEGRRHPKNIQVELYEKIAQSAFGYGDPETSIKRFWDLVQRGLTQRDNVAEESLKYAAEHTIRDVMPFVDSHEIRSQYAEYMRGLLPFWYAEENFLKRWGKILSEGGPAATLQRLERLRLTYMGLQSAGIVREDAQGNDYFVYPGSELLAETVSRLLPGAGLSPGIDVMFQSATNRILPGFTNDWGRPSITPLITAPVGYFLSYMPELKPIDEALVGEEYVNRNALKRFVPASIMRIWDAIADTMDTNDLNPNNERVLAALMAAAAHLQATGNGLPENATSADRDNFIRRQREHARVILVAQALGGYILPGPPVPLQTVNQSSLEWITNGQITNPAELLSSEYYELVSTLGIEQGTVAWLETNPNGRFRDIFNPMAYTISRTYSPSGAPLPSSDEGIDFYLNNQTVIDTFPEAGPWLLPQDEGDDRSQHAYASELIAGLRQRRTPIDFMNAMIYREAAQEYFANQKVYELNRAQLLAGGNTEGATILKDEWQKWQATYLAGHPIFADELQSGAARIRRKNTIDQMRVLIDDPEFPKAPHFDQLKTLQETWDAFMIAKGRLGLDRSNVGQSKVDLLKSEFSSWVSDYLVAYPAVSSYWITVLEPESGLE